MTTLAADIRHSPQTSRREAMERLDALARLLDSAVRVPGTNVRVGADAVLNLIPGAGTLVAKGLAGYLIFEARRHGVPAGTLLRMAGNVAVDLAISAVPLVGWVGDVFWRANQRNIALLRRELALQERFAPWRAVTAMRGILKLGTLVLVAFWTLLVWLGHALIDWASRWAAGHADSVRAAPETVETLSWLLHALGDAGGVVAAIVWVCGTALILAVAALLGLVLPRRRAEPARLAGR